MKWIIFAGLLGFSGFIHSQTLESFSKESSAESPVFMELYTSQGCNSCPPAETWISSFVDNKQLWQRYFPIAFHVTYWNYLGWKDPFSQRQFSKRQYKHLNALNIRQVYTPEFVVNGHEWRGWFERNVKQITELPSKDVGKLKVEISRSNLKAQFKPSDKNGLNSQDYKLYVSLIGSGYHTPITRGENRNKTLQQDFVALTLSGFNLNNNFSVSEALPAIPKSSKQAPKLAWVVWVEYKGKAIQAVGDWLSTPYL
ncbi:DUF1223 domain-containing protein [Parashewanella tropica]|uniref:DUF1223 domain-containing protein n=1 Tax=Parashewanella tropica TaxID=2547970 RepID=UPI001059CECA|nr:DUF1223 domain-containing protein [Parashewanella tropica]